MTLLDSRTASPTPAPRSSLSGGEWCHGVMPLAPRLSEWLPVALAGATPHDLVTQHGSPLNVVSVGPMAEKVNALKAIARDREISFQIYFARKANKCLAFVEAARKLGIGVDGASHAEISQSLAAGLPATSLVCTAAIKDASLIELCLDSGVTMIVDNLDEWHAIEQAATLHGAPVEVALRLSGFEHQGEKLLSRFGLDIEQLATFRPNARGPIRIAGVQFHLDGYSADQRISAIRQSLHAIDRLRADGHPAQFLDIGGGLPVSYLRSQQQWDEFWREHTSALAGRRSEITYRNHSLGRSVVDGQVHGRAECYPYYQSPTAEPWLAGILDAPADDGTVAQAIRRRGLELRCEPGRALLDGCGVTLARVTARKQLASGDWAILLAMNGTQCRTSSADFLVDPLLLPCPSENRGATDGIEGYLFGSRCMESDLILERKLAFPRGVVVGDLVVLPNTAGYLMHFLESRTHQFPLARNLVFDAARGEFALDAIDRFTPA